MKFVNFGIIQGITEIGNFQILKVYINTKIVIFLNTHQSINSSYDFIAFYSLCSVVYIIEIRIHIQTQIIYIYMCVFIRPLKFLIKLRNSHLHIKYQNRNKSIPIR